MTTQTQFLATYRACLLTGPYPWAQDAVKLDRFMQAVASTIERDKGGGPWLCDPQSPLLQSVWREVGLKGRITLKALRALPKTAEVEAA